MPKNKSKRSKKYNPKIMDSNVKLRLRPWRVRAITDPVENILNQLEENGTIDQINGQPVFKDCRSGKWCDSISGLSGMVEMFEIHEIRTGCCLDLAPITVLANKLKYDMPIFPSDTAAARAVVDRIRETTMDMTESYAVELLNDFRLKLHIDAEIGEVL